MAADYVEPPRDGVESRVPTLLLVDADPGACRALQTSLAKVATVHVVVVGRRSEAEAVLLHQPVDAVVAEVRLPDGDGLELLTWLRSRPELAAVPWLVVSSEERMAMRVAAFQAGADDYVAKPVVMVELVARIGAALRRAQRSRTDAGAGRLIGDFSVVAFTDLVHLLHVTRRSGQLNVLTANGPAALTFVTGSVYHACDADCEGEEAFYGLMFAGEGRFEFTPCAIDLQTVRNTVALTPTFLLMEGARRLDSWRRSEAETEAETEAPTVDATDGSPALP